MAEDVKEAGATEEAAPEMVLVELKNAIAHNGVLYARGIAQIPRNIADELMAIRNCQCPVQIGAQSGHECPGALLNHAVPYELVRPVPIRPVPAVDATTGAPVDASTHKLNVADSIALIQKTDDVPKLKSLMEGEKKHPQFQGGRKTILEAITAQLMLLAS
jgi:hypothetical protein